MNSKHIKKILDKQFKIANVDLKFEDVKDNKIPNWYKKFSYSEEGNKKWKDWMISYFKKILKFTKERAIIEAAWIEINYGLKVNKKSKTKNIVKNTKKTEFR